jgi:hypothetical protein
MISIAYHNGKAIVFLRRSKGKGGRRKAEGGRRKVEGGEKRQVRKISQKERCSLFFASSAPSPSYPPF